MRFSFITAGVVLAAGASAQITSSVSSPLTLLQYASALLSTSCRTTVTGLVQANSSFAQCLHVSGLSPILNNTATSVIPNINTYLTGLCASSACNATVINATQNAILSSCKTDLATFGISNSTVSTIFQAYPVAREIACLSSNSTTLNSTTSSANRTNSTLCPISLLNSVQTYLGTPLTNSYIDSLILGANATAYNSILAVGKNSSLIKQFACNDCVAGSLDIVFESYPTLANATLTSSQVAAVKNYTGLNVTGALTVPAIYQGICAVSVGPNATLPKSLNETAYNTTVGPLNATVAKLNTTTSANKTSVPVSRKRFVRWD